MTSHISHYTIKQSELMHFIFIKLKYHLPSSMQHISLEPFSDKVLRDNVTELLQKYYVLLNVRVDTSGLKSNNLTM